MKDGVSDQMQEYLETIYRLEEEGQVARTLNHRAGNQRVGSAAGLGANRNVGEVSGSARSLCVNGQKSCQPRTLPWATWPFDAKCRTRFSCSYAKRPVIIRKIRAILPRPYMPG